MTVQAVLCWSEYYNGKWQPTKTSDVNQPLSLSEFPVTGPGSFDRSILRLGIIEGASANSSFISVPTASVMMIQHRSEIFQTIHTFIARSVYSTPIRFR